MKETSVIVEGLLFGMTIALAIGPIALLIINAGINRGLKAGLACGLGAAAADFTYAIGGFFAGATALALLDGHREGAAILAAVTLCLLGVWLIIGAWRNRNRRVSAATARGPGFVATYLLTLANPLTLLFFAAWIGGREHTGSPLHIVLVACAVFLGSVLVQSALAAGGSLLRTWLTRPGFLLSANLLSGAGIVAFGLFRLARI